MYKGKKFLGIIPARGGSKGLPKKNIMPLCDKPLIGWTIESALKSRYLDTVMVTTDCEEIAEVSRGFGAVTPFLRPPELATDVASSIDVVKHAVRFYEHKLGEKFDYIVLLEPTSPLREAGDIDAMIEKAVSLGFEVDAVVSMGEAHEHPSIMKRISDGGIAQFCQNLQMTSRRQDNQPAYFPYGVAYIVKTRVVFDEETFYPDRTTYYLLKRYQCYEIDDIYDFLAVENIMKYEWGFK